MKLLLILLALVGSNIVYAGKSLPEFEVEKISQGVYLHKSYQRVKGFGVVGSNGLVVIDGDNAFIIDTPWSDSDTEKLVSWVNKQGHVLAGSVSTHWHGDRTAGVKWLNAHSIPTYASKLTNEFLKKAGRELATNTFDQPEYRLAVANMEAFYPGAGHTMDNIVVWLPKSKILYGGCLIRSLEAKGLGYTGEASIDKWSDSVAKVLSRYPEAQIVIPGHGRFGDIRLLEHTKRLAESASGKLIQPTAKTLTD